jgi:hypothetical protein
MLSIILERKGMRPGWEQVFESEGKLEEEHISEPVLFIHSFIPLACAECDNSVLFSGASSIPICYILFPATLLHQLFFCPPSLHLVIYEGALISP